MTRRSLSVLLLVMVIAGCGGSDDAKGPTATVGPDKTTESTTTTTKAMTPEEEVEAAYLKSWDVYAKAMRTLDDSAYPTVYAGDALTLRREELAKLKAANTPAQMKVEHGYTITILAADRAVVVDDYRNHSVLVDPETGQPTEADPNNRLQRKYDMRKDGDQWLIVAITSLS